MRGEEYDSFIDEFVSALSERWPHVMLQWEDFAKSNATRILDRYRNKVCSFNDDIQGTAAVATGALLAAINVTGVPMQEQRIAILGGGSAGCGIASLLMSAMVDAGLDAKDAARRFYLVDKDGLLVEGMADIAPFQKPFLQPRAALASWNTGNPNRISLLDVIYNAKPTALIGVSAQTGAFTESVVRAMAKRQQATDYLPVVEPEFVRGSDAGRHRALERRPRHHRRRLAVSADHAQRQTVQRRPVEQFLHLPRRRPGGDRHAREAHHRQDVHGGSQGTGGNVAGAHQSGSQSACRAVTELREVAIAVAIAVGRQAHAEGLDRGRRRRRASRTRCAPRCGRRATCSLLPRRREHLIRNAEDLRN